MALVAFEGFEGSIVTPEFSGVSLNNGGARTGNGYHEADSNLVCTLPSATSKITVGVACQFTDTPSSALTIISLRDTAGAQQLTLTQDTASGSTLKVKRGSQTGAVIADTGFTPVYGAWYYIEMQATLDDTAGICIVKIDGVQVVNFVGDTRNAGALTNWGSWLGFNNVSGGSWKQDDIYVLDHIDDSAVTGRPDNDFLGPIKVQALYPNGNGALSQLVGSDGNSVDNYLLVDEAPTANTTDYVGSAVVGSRDLYAMQDLDPAATTVLGLRASAYLSKTDTGAIGAKIVLKETNGTGSEATSSQFLPGSGVYAHYHGVIRKTKPSGGAWTPADVNALQVGVEVTNGL